MAHESKIFRITLAREDVANFLAACEDAEWYAFDTGERVMTDDGPDAEAVLLVEPKAVTSSRIATAVPA